MVVVFATMFGLTMVANERSKESHVKDGTLTTLDGARAVGVEPVESYVSLYDIPMMTPDVLATMDGLTVMADMTSDSEVQGVAELYLKVASVWRPKGLRYYPARAW